MNDVFDNGPESIPDGYAIVMYPGLPLIDALLGEKREIVPFYGSCHVRDFYGTPNRPFGEVEVVAWNYEQAVEMLEATQRTGLQSLIRYVGKLISGS